MKSGAVLKIVCLTGLFVGLVSAGVGVYRLDVEAAVLSLIVASVSGLYLLKMRAEAQGRLDRSA